MASHGCWFLGDLLSVRYAFGFQYNALKPNLSRVACCRFELFTVDHFTLFSHQDRRRHREIPSASRLREMSPLDSVSHSSGNRSKRKSSDRKYDDKPRRSEKRLRSTSRPRSGPRTPPEDQEGTLFSEIRKQERSSRSLSRPGDGSFAAAILKGKPVPQESPRTPVKVQPPTVVKLQGQPLKDAADVAKTELERRTEPINSPPPAPAVLQPYANLPLPSVVPQPGVVLQEVVPKRPKPPVVYVSFHQFCKHGFYSCLTSCV